MSSKDSQPILNASEVIERFGGIRPMAKKIDVAVTTIQGWKKRDVIPAARMGDIMKAAAVHEVDLSGLVEGAPAVNQNEPKQAQSESPSAVVQGSGEKISPAAISAVAEDAPIRAAQESMGSPFTAPLSEPVIAGERPAIAAHHVPWIYLILAFVAVLALAAILFPQKTAHEAPSPVETPATEHSFLGTLIPQNLDEQINALKEQAGQAQETIGVAVEKAQEISQDVLAENAGTLDQRYQKLQEHAAEIAASPELQGMLSRLQTWGANPIGQERLDSAMSQISAMMGSLGAGAAEPGAFEGALQEMREKDVVVNQTFEGVPQEDLKAAALLLGMNQFRDALGRDNKPFADDLQVLMGLVGDGSPELTASLEKLAPHAETGVLTPAGLAQELKGMAGDAVVASLKGEDVSITEKAKAKLHEVFQVEKAGEPVTGTETQTKIDRAQRLVDAGDVEGALSQVQGLDASALTVMQPWIEKAQGTLMAGQAREIVQQTMSSIGGLSAGGARLIRNEETGINILTPSASSQMRRAMPQSANPAEQP